MTTTSKQPPSSGEAMSFVEWLRSCEEDAFCQMVQTRWPPHVRRILDDMFNDRLTILAQTLDALRGCHDS